MKYLTDNIADEYKVWLRSYDNPNYTGQKYDFYHLYLDKIIDRAVELNLIDASEVLLTDINWLNKFQKLYESSSLLKNADKSNANGGGIASLKRFIDFIKFKEKQNVNINKDRETLFVEYLKDCGICNDRDNKSPKLGSLNNYYRELIIHCNKYYPTQSPFDYEDDLEFKALQDKIIEIDRGNDPTQGAKYYCRFLAECKFKRLLEWFIQTVRDNSTQYAHGINPTVIGKGGADRIRQHYEKWRHYIGFSLDCNIGWAIETNMAGRNYIYYPGTYINITPIAKSKGTLSDFEKLVINVTPNTESVREQGKNRVISNILENSIDELGLYDNSFPNEVLRKFFNTYSSLILEYKADKDKFNKKYGNTSSEETSMINISTPTNELNLILYGPPGTGKTYNTVRYAVAIIEKKSKEEIEQESYSDVFKRYKQYIKDERIAFTTFHQAYGYEEFIEGIKPVLDEDEIKYDILPGTFKKFCDNARKLKNEVITNYGFNSSPTVWKVSLEGTGDNPTRRDCLANNRIRIGWDGYGKNLDEGGEVKDGKNVLNAFLNKMRIGDIVLSCYTATTVDAIGVVTGEYEWLNENFSPYRRSRSVKWIVKGIREEISEINNGKAMTLPSVYQLNISVDDVLRIINDNEKKSSEADEYDYDTPYVFIIDEINRGNVAKIFGELITLIEPSKRLGTGIDCEETTCILPYSQEEFGVPKNVYILGTMNTADRSLVQLDAALRRRFAFEEMMPDYNVIAKKVGENGIVDGINIKELLQAINERISVRLDREHQIGHSYFMKLDKNSTAENVATIFKKNIIPLLQEYFFDDYNSIKEVLNNKFVTEEDCKYDKDKKVYKIDISEAQNKDFIEIYGGNSKNESAINTND